MTTVRTDAYVPNFVIHVDGQRFLYGRATEIVSVSITETSNQADQFTIAVRDRYPDPASLRRGALSWIDNTAFQEGKEIEIALGYQKNMGVELMGYITGIAISFSEDGRSGMTVRGYNKYHDLQRSRRYKPFETSTYSGIAREIAGAVNLTADVDETDAEHPLTSWKGDTYAAILEQCAKRVNYEVAVKHGSLLFRRPRYLETPRPAPALELVWGQSLRSLSVDMKTNNMASSVTVRNTKTGEGQGKEPVVAKLTAGEVSPVLGETSGLKRAEAVWGENDVHLEGQPVASSGEAKQLARAELERRALGYITANGSCMGNPKLLARTLITLSGLGPRCSGTYYVTSTTHTIDTGGYRTEFTAQRDAR